MNMLSDDAFKVNQYWPLFLEDLFLMQQSNPIKKCCYLLVVQNDLKLITLKKKIFKILAEINGFLKLTLG